MFKEFIDKFSRFATSPTVIQGIKYWSTRSIKLSENVLMEMSDTDLKGLVRDMENHVFEHGWTMQDVKDFLNGEPVYREGL